MGKLPIVTFYVFLTLRISHVLSLVSLYRYIPLAGKLTKVINMVEKTDIVLFFIV